VLCDSALQKNACRARQRTHRRRQAACTELCPLLRRGPGSHMMDSRRAASGAATTAGARKPPAHCTGPWMARHRTRCPFGPPGGRARRPAAAQGTHTAPPPVRSRLGPPCASPPRAVVVPRRPDSAAGRPRAPCPARGRHECGTKCGPVCRRAVAIAPAMKQGRPTSASAGSPACGSMGRAWGAWLLLALLPRARAFCVFTPDANGHVDYPSGETSVPSKAFYECDSLVSITLPSSLTSIGACLPVLAELSFSQRKFFSRRTL